MAVIVMSNPPLIYQINERAMEMNEVDDVFYAGKGCILRAFSYLDLTVINKSDHHFSQHLSSPPSLDLTIGF